MRMIFVIEHDGYILHYIQYMCVVKSPVKSGYRADIGGVIQDVDIHQLMLYDKSVTHLIFNFPFVPLRSELLV